MNEAVSFLIQCYFGKMEHGPIVAAIDRAYIDMQTLIVKGDPETELFPRRKAITEYLYSQLQLLQTGKQDFDAWHRETSEYIHDNFMPTLTYGQIQKWINMTIKYLYTYRQLQLPDVDDYYSEMNAEAFHAPIDSYVLKAIGRENLSWSKDIDDYDEYLKLAEQISFKEEYKHWAEYATSADLRKDGMPKKAEKSTYARFIQDNPYRLY